jgi:proline iminopeptidase
VTTDRYPIGKPYNAGWLPPAEGHEVWFEESGNPRGVPIVYLHGGPGMGLEAHVRRQYDPAFYRLIQFDQLGCG